MDLKATLESILEGPLPEQQQGLANLDARLEGKATAAELLEISSFLDDHRLLVPENLLNLLVRLGVPDAGKTLESGPQLHTLLSAMGPKLVEWLSQADPRIRGRASAALIWCIPAPGALGDRLVQAIERERYDDCRAVQGMALGVAEWRAGSTRHVDVLMKLLERGRSQIRPLAAVGLAFCSPQTATADVAKALLELGRVETNLIPWLRDLPGAIWLAAIALAKLPEKRADAVLLIDRALKQGVGRGEAIRALLEVGGPRPPETSFRSDALSQLTGLAPFNGVEAHLLEQAGLPTTAERLRGLAEIQ
jgi:hypothetical protein